MTSATADASSTEPSRADDVTSEEQCALRPATGSHSVESSCGGSHVHPIITKSSSTSNVASERKGRRQKNKDSRGGDNARNREPFRVGGADPFQKIPISLPEIKHALRLSSAERAQLEQWLRSRTAPHRVVVRSRLVLLASGGTPVAIIARQLGIAPSTVRLWTRRFERGGLAALTREAPGRGRPSGMSVPLVERVLEAISDALPGDRSVRRVAAHAGVSASTVWRVWKRYGLGSASTREAVVDVLRKLISETHSETGWR